MPLNVIDLDADLPPIRVDVPIHLHPSALLGTKELNVEGTYGVEALGAARQALTHIHTAFSGIEDVQKALVAAAKPVTRHQNVTNKPNTPVRMSSDYSDPAAMEVGDDGNIRQKMSNEDFIKHAAELYKRVAPQVEQKVATLKGIHAVLVGKIDAAVDHPPRKTPEGIATAQEVRAHVKSLGEKYRYTFVVDAIHDGDKATAAAVIHAQPFLSGFTPKQVEMLRECAAVQWAPQEFSQSVATAKLIDQVYAAGSALLGRVAKVTQLRETKEAIINKKIKALSELK
jgi:hypothetical protein